jgi:hypothetical protein
MSLLTNGRQFARIIALCGAVFVAGITNSSAAAVADAPAPSAPALKWRQVVSEKGKFEIQMPGEPQISSSESKGKNGHSFQMTTYMVDLGNRAYLIMYSDYDDETIVSVPGALEGVLKSWKDPKITKRESTTVYAHPAEVLEFTTEEYRVRFLVLAVGKRLYQIATLATLDTFVPADVDKYMKSFQLAR